MNVAWFLKLYTYCSFTQFAVHIKYLFLYCLHTIVDWLYLIQHHRSTFATEGANCSVDPLVEKTIKAFQSAGKPLAFCCIAPVLAAKVIPGVKITLGMDKGMHSIWRSFQNIFSLCVSKNYLKIFLLAKGVSKNLILLHLMDLSSVGKLPFFS